MNETVCCSTSHHPIDTACVSFEAGMNGRCVYCDHEEKCHPGPGATCWIGSGEKGSELPSEEEISTLLSSASRLRLERTPTPVLEMMLDPKTPEHLRAGAAMAPIVRQILNNRKSATKID